MKISLKYGGILFLLTMLLSCREKFDNDLPSSDASAIVVDGVIDDGPGPYLVKLSRAVSFNDDKQIKISNAEVYVIDDLNRRFDFKEKSAGFYYTDTGEFRARTGGIYTLFINTKEGLRYKSTPCSIAPPCLLDSVFITEETLQGCQINGNISFRRDQDISLKIDADESRENVKDSISVRYDTLDLYNDTIMFIDKIEYHYITKNYSTMHLGSEPVLKSNTDYNNGSRIKNIPFLFLNWPVTYTDSVVYDTLTKIRYISATDFIVIINASTISNETFNYYSNLVNQIGGKDPFFEPLPVQLTGNIACINDKSKAAYGLFQANAIVKKYFKIENYNLVEINGIPPLKFYTISYLKAIYEIRR